jgi:excisionase family DNA binding protein
MNAGAAMIGEIDAILSLLPDDGRVAFSIKELASMTGVSERTIHRRIKEGSIPVVRSGGRTLIPKPSATDKAT